MAAAQPRIKLQFQGILGEYLEEHDLQKCWYQLPAVSKKGSAMQTVSDLITTLCEAFDLLGAAANSDLVLELDGFTVISNSPLSLFRDGDTVIIRSKQKWQTATVPVTNGRQVEGGKRKRSEVALALTAAEDQQAEMSRPRKRKKSSVSVTETAQAAVEAADNESAAQSDDDNGNESLPPAPTQANDGPATVQQQPSDPQSSSQGQNSHKRKPAGVMGSGSGAVPSGPAKPGPASNMDRAGPSVALPESDAECAALPAVHAYPMPGDIVAYKLLEIGANWAPEVSEWRHGEVGAADLAGTVVIMPLAGQGSQTVPFAEANGHAVEEEDGEEEEEEGPPSNYDEDGILTTELPAFAELRLIKASPNPTNLPAGPPAAPTAPPAGTAAQLQSFQDGINTPGAVRPRGGVRASAMGPMLAHLRSSGAFENTV
ncbi:hypothetical protein WJX79_007140 [Trebouxia sp. C0005]